MVFVEHRADDASVPIKALHKMSEKHIWIEAMQHVVMFRKR